MLTVACPILASLDFDETEAFYGRLGFRRGGRYPDYLILLRDRIELHFWRCHDRAIAEATGAYLRVSDARALHAEFAASGDVRQTLPKDEPYGIREFAVWDVHGNLLRIGENLTRQADED